MSTASMRKALVDILEYARAGNMEEIIHTTQDALHTLDGGRLLTTREATSYLGIRSINTLKPSSSATLSHISALAIA